MKRRGTSTRSSEVGVTLVELLVAFCIFSVVMMVALSAYTGLSRHSATEYRLAESGIETEIAKNIIERDLMMAGYGLADDYGDLSVSPLPVEAEEDSTGDSLLLRGTAIGILSRSAQGWSYIEGVSPLSFQQWDDARENISSGDRVIYVDPTSREILTAGPKAVFKYPQMPSSAGRGTLVYGLHSDNAALPYYSVEYLLGGTPPSVCAPGTLNLLRAESKDNDPPVPANRKPIMNCVADFQVALGLDTDDDGLIDLWDPAQTGVFESGKYDIKTQRKRIRQVRVYILVQNGNYDPYFTYSNPDDEADPDTMRAGDSRLETGRCVHLTPVQRKYRWKVVSISVTPRNL
jgi:hypothetical protein